MNTRAVLRNHLECSSHTGYKHKLFRRIVREHLTLHQVSHSSDAYTYVDLNAGPFVYPETAPGASREAARKCSGKVFVEEATALGIPVTVHLVENDPDVYYELRDNVQVHLGDRVGRDVFVHRSDNLTFARAFVEGNRGRKPRGLVFADPIGAGNQEFLALQEIGVFSQLDITMHVHAAAIKRHYQKSNSWQHTKSLSDYVDGLHGRCALFSQPRQSQQFTMMIASNNGFCEVAEKMDFQGVDSYTFERLNKVADPGQYQRRKALGYYN